MMRNKLDPKGRIREQVGPSGQIIYKYMLYELDYSDFDFSGPVSGYDQQAFLFGY